MKNSHTKPQAALSLAGIQAMQTLTAQRNPSDLLKLQRADLVNSFIGNPAWSGNSLCICWEA